MEWHKTDSAAGETSSYYLGGFVDLPFGPGFRFAAEFDARVDSGLRYGSMVRADYLGRPFRWLELHAGYQFHWYQEGFGPRDRVLSPTAAYNTPQQEDAYVTNSFEYLGISNVVNQWSHTGMLELRPHLGSQVDLLANGELWNRTATAPSDIAIATETPEGSLFALAAYITIEAAKTLVMRERPNPTLVGLGLMPLSMIAMWYLARAKRRSAASLRSRAMEADSFQTSACFWLSFVTLVGIALNAAFGWWWADPVAALGMTFFLVVEAREAWRGEDSCSCSSSSPE